MSIYKGEKLISGSASGSASATAYPKPDWANAVSISAGELYAGYTAPSDGMFVCTGVMPLLGDGVRKITVNDIVIAAGEYYSSGSFSYGDTSCPVSKGDLIKASTSNAWQAETRYFVPWK